MPPQRSAKPTSKRPSGSPPPKSPRRLQPAHVAVVLAFALPLVAFWIDVAWLHPASNYYTVDTEFPYFLNSLSVFKGVPYTYVDHPGTPMEVFGTLVLALTYPFLGVSREGFISFHIAHPAVFLDTVRSLLMLAHMAAAVVLFAVARRGRQLDATLGAAAVATLYFVVQPYALLASTVWNHNSFSFALGALLLVALWRVLETNRVSGQIPPLQLILLGVGTGVLSAITIYLSAWVLGLLVAVTLFYLISRKPWPRALGAAALAAFSAVAGFGLAVLPVARKLPVFQNWILGILTHQSRYLAVPADESMPVRLAANLGELARILPTLVAVSVLLIAASVVALIAFRNHLRSRAGAWAFVGGLVVQIGALLLVFLDRPLREAYLLSIAAVLPLLAMSLLILIEDRPRILRPVRIALAVLVFVGLVLTSARSVAAKREETAALKQTLSRTSELISDYARATGRAPQDVTVLWMYGAYAPCWGLRTGDALAGNNFAFEVDAVCPHQYRLSANLRYDVHGEGIAVQEGPWDIIFTCDQYVRRLTDVVPDAITQSFPEIQWGCGAMNELRRR